MVEYIEWEALLHWIGEPREVEGDLLYGKGKRGFRVDYNADIAGFVAHAVDGGASTPCLNVGTMGYYEVNGNIHDNPELGGGQDG